MTTQAAKNLPLLVALAALLAPAAAFAQGQVYKYKDASGQTHYSDRAPSDAQQVKAPQPPKTGAPAGPAAPAANATANSASNAAPPLPVSREQQAQVQQDLAGVRAEQCRKLRENYDSSIRAQRIYKTNDKGEREFLSPAEADAARLQLKAEMDSACGS